MQVYPGARVMQKEPQAELASVLLGVVKARPDQVAGHPQYVLRVGVPPSLGISLD